MVGGITAFGGSGHKAPCKAGSSYTRCGALAKGSAFPAPLFQQMASDMQSHNEAGFLSHVAPRAQPALRAWYRNMQAIGFNAVVIRSNSAHGGVVPVDSQGNGTVQVAAGARSPLDPQFSAHGGSAGHVSYPVVPSENYQVGFHESGFGAVPEITSWQPLGDAPWDQGTSLYVQRGTDVVVAGYPDEQALVNQTVPIAEAAASYDLTLFQKFLPQAVRQSGFIVFVSADSSRRDGWFGGGQQVKGWQADPAGLTVPAVGITAAGSAPYNGIGGAFVVLDPAGGASQETSTLVNEFVHDIYISDDISGGTDPLWSFGSNDNVPTWAIEGIATFVESLYRSNPDPSLPKYPDTWLPQQLSAFPASDFAGQPPTTAQLYSGSASTGTYAYDVSASIYLYIAENDGGISTVMDAALRAYLTDNSPLSDVVRPDTTQPVAASTVEQGWPSWFRQTFQPKKKKKKG